MLGLGLMISHKLRRHDYTTVAMDTECTYTLNSSIVSSMENLTFTKTEVLDSDMAFQYIVKSQDNS